MMAKTEGHTVSMEATAEVQPESVERRGSFE